MKYIWANIYSTTHLWSACYLDEKGILKAIELERLDRYKNSPNLSSFWLIPKLDNYFRKKIIDYFSIKWEYKSINFDKKNIIEKHHYLHACSVYYSNNIEKAAVLCMDRNGYDLNFWNQFQTIWKAKDMHLELKYSTQIDSQLDRWIWFAYYIISEFLKLWEWSVMWLSSYWDKNIYKNIKIYEYRDNGVYFNKKFLQRTIYDFSNNSTFFKRYDSFDEMYWNRDIIFENIKNIFGLSNQDLEFAKNNIVNSKFSHIAALLQYQTEEAILYLAKKAYKLYPSKNLCLAWWVALNILANTRILKETKFENIFISPVSEDIWLSLWAFYHLYHIQEKNITRVFLEKTWYWNSYSKSMILKTLDEFWDYLTYEKLTQHDIYEKTANKLMENKVLWWFQWWSEFWPRALGNRSIIASPSCLKIKNKINKIKSRELWRPLAPSILEDSIKDYFDIDFLSPFMSFSWNIKKSKLWFIDWVTHIDNTSRYQSVGEVNNKKYYDLIKKFKEKSWIPIIINTSFNVSREPIVETPIDALKMFLSTDIDYLILDNFFIKKSKKTDKFRFNYENIRLKRNLVFSKNKQAIINRKYLNNKFEKLFKNYDFKIYNNFYDESISFFIDGFKYILEFFSSSSNYLHIEKKTWLIKLWRYSINDDKIINIIYKKSDIIDFMFSNDYVIKDY